MHWMEKTAYTTDRFYLVGEEPKKNFLLCVYEDKKETNLPSFFERESPGEAMESNCTLAL